MRWINYLALGQGKYGHNSIHCQRAPPYQSRESVKKGTGSRHLDQKSARLEKIAKHEGKIKKLKKALK
ncbi:TPA: hypothetical protein ACNU26_003670 [Aeromonas salmonicida]